jgi:ketosteroid isomerase-like protein
MKPSARLPVATALLLGLAAAGCVGPLRCLPLSPEEKIWALENAYWTANRQADVEKITALWHDGFLGWPESEERPIGKAEGAAYLRKTFPAPGSFTFAIERAGIRIVGDVAVNHYTVETTSRDATGQERKRRLRIVHTWVKDGGAWRMLGGMSCAQS